MNLLDSNSTREKKTTTKLPHVNGLAANKTCSYSAHSLCNLQQADEWGKTKHITTHLTSCNYMPSWKTDQGLSKQCIISSSMHPSLRYARAYNGDDIIKSFWHTMMGEAQEQEWICPHDFLEASRRKKINILVKINTMQDNNISYSKIRCCSCDNHIF